MYLFPAPHDVKCIYYFLQGIIYDRTKQTKLQTDLRLNIRQWRTSKWKPIYLKILEKLRF